MFKFRRAIIYQSVNCMRLKIFTLKKKKKKLYLIPEWVLALLQVATTGYVGLGFSPTGGMKGADIIIGWVDGEGRVLLQVRLMELVC